MDLTLEEENALIDKLSNSALDIKKYNNEKNLMLYPFCSTSKRKRISPINYVSNDGSRWLQVTANNTYGMAKIWDFDILRFVFSKIATIAESTGHYPSKVSFTAYECLKALSRDPKAGKNIRWLREALDRLASTTYKGNLFKEDSKHVTGFTLIKYDYQEVGNGIEKIIISLDERLVESIRMSTNLLEINKQLLREESGIKKRLLELVDASMKNNISWSISLEHLQKLCANDWNPSRFKFEVLNYHNLPWDIIQSKELNTVIITFKKKMS